MKGRYSILVDTDHMQFQLSLRRKVTVLQGNSGTGKTVLTWLLSLHEQMGERCGVHVVSDAPCVVYNWNEELWRVLFNVHQSILFIDEGSMFVASHEFADYILQSDNIFVLVTRMSLPEIPSEMQEICGIRTEGHSRFPEKVFHFFCPIHDAKNQNSSVEAGRPLERNDSDKYLRAVFGKGKWSCHGPSWFKANYSPEWFKDEFVQKMIEDVDRSRYVDGLVIDSPVLGPISPERLSGGVQTLIMIYERPDLVFDATSCGENCAKWLLEIGKRKDVTVNLQYLMPFTGFEPFQIFIENEQRIVRTCEDYVQTAVKYL